MKMPPKEWPMMMGGSGRARMMRSYESTISVILRPSSAFGLRRTSRGVRSPIPGHPGTMTSWPCSRYRSAQVSQLEGVIHSPWTRTMAGLSFMELSLSNSG